jgi:hypothetical protein
MAAPLKGKFSGEKTKKVKPPFNKGQDDNRKHDLDSIRADNKGAGETKVRGTAGEKVGPNKFMKGKKVKK